MSKNLNQQLIKNFREALDCKKENKEILLEETRQLDKLILKSKRLPKLKVKQLNHLIFRTVMLSDRIDRVLHGLVSAMLKEKNND